MPRWSRAAPYNFVMEEKENLHLRPIRSFVLRQGRMSPAQTRAYETVGPKFMVPHDPPAMLEYAKLFGRAAPTIVEIGFGMGESTAAIAKLQPEKNFIGIEVHTPGVGALLKLIGEQEISNLRIVQHDAVEVLKQMIPDGSLDGFHIFFPDPWPKKRHHKRRLIQPDLVKLLVQKLKPDGYLHLATDWEDYAMHMLEVLQAEPGLANTAETFAPRPDYRGTSGFERKGLAKGHDVWDLVYRRK
ncbi:MAG: tRNA (guanosine(46)-N7)-methyltransferase TrmB [Betaproteobacteria bacterium]|nr:tRNA (guanosine(46)-N7)-methyltransferase TrmB [Betaproteobacteria bacterium]